MRSVLEELYYGNIHGDSRMYAKDSAFVQAAKRKVKHMNALAEMLDEQGKEEFDQYCDAQGDIEGITRYDTFTYALKLGILLMTEVFMTSSEVVGEDLSFEDITPEP